MQVDARDVERAIIYLKEAMKALAMVGEASPYYFSAASWEDVNKNTESYVARAVKAMKEIPVIGKQCLWHPDDFRPLVERNVPASLLHVCIFEEACGEFKKPNLLGDLQGDWWEGFYSNPSDEMKAEWEFRCRFADLLDYIGSSGG